MAEFNKNDVNWIGVNAGIDFSILGTKLKVVVERGESQTQALIILREELGSVGGTLRQLKAELKKLFTGFGAEYPGELSEKMDKLLSETTQVDDIAFIESLKATLVQLFILITKPDNGKIGVEFAFSVKINCDGEKRGVFDFFGMEDIFVNIWNVSQESRFYEKMGIETIEELMK